MTYLEKLDEALRFQNHYAELENYNKKLLEGDIDKQNKIALLSKKVNDLQKENAELKGEASSVLDNWCRGDDPCPHLKKRDDQLTKAKGIIQSFVWWHTGEDRGSIDSNELVARAEQFLKDSEVENEYPV